MLADGALPDLAGAVTKTVDNGTVDVLTPGDYGPVVIHYPITIDGSGSGAGIRAGTGATGIVIAAGAGNNVTLRDLDISGPGCTAAGAGDGISFVSGGAVHLDDVTARGFAGSGAALAPAAGTTVTVRGGAYTENCTAGIAAAPASSTLGVAVDRPQPAELATL